MGQDLELFRSCLARIHDGIFEVMERGYVPRSIILEDTNLDMVLGNTNCWTLESGT